MGGNAFLKQSNTVVMSQKMEKKKNNLKTSILDRFSSKQDEARKLFSALASKR